MRTLLLRLKNLPAWVRRKKTSALLRFSSSRGKESNDCLIANELFPFDIECSFKSFAAFEGASPKLYKGSLQLAEGVAIRSFGISFKEWRIHFWIQKLPLLQVAKFQISEIGNDDYLILQNNSQDKINPEINSIALNFKSPNSANFDNWILDLKQQDIIWDPDPSRVCFLQSIGLKAYWLNPEAMSNGWLDKSSAQEKDGWAKNLGLAPPPLDHILVLGCGGSELDRSLGYEAKCSTNTNNDSLSYFPGWEELIIETKLDAFLQAGWISCATSLENNIVWINPRDYFDETFLKLFNTPINLVKTPISSMELRSIFKDENSLAFYEDRFKSEFETSYIWESSVQPKVAVAISLFNYEDRIVDALQSVQDQTQSQIELIVVDDASEDSSLNVVRKWMIHCLEKKQHSFARILLLKHKKNRGLAAARNTAFSSAKSDWCFVLDADNQLFPEAISTCIELTKSCSENLAVIHPLLLVESEQGREDDKRSLSGHAPWQKQRLKHENTIDAMALVRNSAWKTVGGYTHIEGGWEDYDFWCKLIDQGFHGIQCPKVLALYRSHNRSMSHRFTNINWKELSRTLFKRHPWMTPRALQPKKDSSL